MAEDEEHSAATEINELPDECLFRALELLVTKADRNSAALACQRWHRIHRTNRKRFSFKSDDPAFARTLSRLLQQCTQGPPKLNLATSGLSFGEASPKEGEALIGYEACVRCVCQGITDGGDMGKKKRKATPPPKAWCYYCEREFDDEAILVDHQRAKHFQYPVCHMRLTTVGGMVTHCLQVHKMIVDSVPNAKPGRKPIAVDVHGISGIPESIPPGVLVNFLVCSKLEVLKQPEPPSVKLVLQLFKFLFAAIAKSQGVCDRVLQPPIATLMGTCMKKATEVDKPQGYMQLLHVMFHSLSVVKFELPFQEFIPYLQPCLNMLLAMLEGPAGEGMADLVVELCLSMFARLSVLLPHLPRLMKPIVLALKGKGELVGLGLRIFFRIDHLASMNVNMGVGYLVSSQVYSPVSAKGLKESVYAPHSISPLQVFVKLLNGRTCIVRVGHSDSIDSLFSIVSAKEGVPPRFLRLIFAGKQLDGERSIKEYGIVQDSSISVVLRLRGGMSRRPKSSKLQSALTGRKLQYSKANAISSKPDSSLHENPVFQEEVLATEASEAGLATLADKRGFSSLQEAFDGKRGSPNKPPVKSR